jgi:Aerobic-type carbon monoxide dehydrogenase, large subunit CoxL/CutL homologs
LHACRSTLEDPHIPGKINVDFVEAGFARGPFGAKGLGEPSIVGIAPSIANAIAHALRQKRAKYGVNKIPVTPDFLYEVIKKYELKKQ